MLPEPTTAPLVEVVDERLRGVRLLLKRDDLVHPDIPGNKWRKLKHNLAPARAAGRVLTFGGAHSNHIRAVAAAGVEHGFETIGVIRGEEHLPLNDVLAFATACGMELTYLDRATYRRKGDPDVLATLDRRFGPYHLLPEGGSNELGVRGCREIIAELPDFDVVCCPCGTGATLAGLALGLGPRQSAVGFAVLRGGFLPEAVRGFTGGHGGWEVDERYHFGGYAKVPPELDEFAEEFTRRHAVPVERLYVAKMLYGVYARAAAGEFKPGTTVVAVITG
ncbi:1-aminocyclopropane-1-carboxylate deaminase/D-cysteine desulfhydrase [Actinokineospora bangkokensis]|uniref:1-aminocyclopropane-1-carboxylate deaminase n=1 Tax=Actinokineospora bangkokensis TaxID=1193682 RepID=A0A1Q9LTT3_9PSEU|nr:pyridoxal-phosphate dependent enzyme [Actinokineospora bangkokensis]OLR95457.1 1-aminocyclopropane-1-carboxylate deaminase [Actinokineospora bangkokensis]